MTASRPDKEVSTEGKQSGLVRNLWNWKQRHSKSRDTATHRAENEAHLAIVQEMGFILCFVFGKMYEKHKLRLQDSCSLGDPVTQSSSTFISCEMYKLWSTCLALTVFGCVQPRRAIVEGAPAPIVLKKRLADLFLPLQKEMRAAQYGDAVVHISLKSCPCTQLNPPIDGSFAEAEI
jgi:hypothetical protein